MQNGQYDISESIVSPAMSWRCWSRFKGIFYTFSKKILLGQNRYLAQRFHIWRQEQKTEKETRGEGLRLPSKHQQLAVCSTILVLHKLPGVGKVTFCVVFLCENIEITLVSFYSPLQAPSFLFKFALGCIQEILKHRANQSNKEIIEC